jgi:hypothetical protein
MRRNDRNAGPIKALIVLTLLIANIVVALPRRTVSSPSKRGEEHPRFVARAHPAVSLDERSQP